MFGITFGKELWRLFCETPVSQENEEEDRVTLVAVPALLEEKEQDEGPVDLFFQEFEMPIYKLLMGKGTSKLLKKGAKHRIRNASKRIFHDPLRSFLEIVVNGLDAMHPEFAIGKFGMGFLSILSFFEHPETEGCRIEILTTYRRSGYLFSYKMIIEERDETPWVKFVKVKNLPKTGTTISIIPNEGDFSKKTIDKIYQYLLDLQLVDYSSLKVKTEEGETKVGKGKSEDVVISLNKDRLVVVDQGGGIPLKVAKKKLFVPTDSTKSEAPEDRSLHGPQLCYLEGKKDQNASHLVMTIGGPIVVNLKLEHPILDAEGKVADIHIKLPADTRLTLSRDAIEFTGAGRKTRQYLDAVLVGVIEQIIEGNQDACLILTGLYFGFKKWEKTCPSVAKQRFSNTLIELVQHKIVEQEEMYIIPLKEKDLIRSFLKGMDVSDYALFIPLPEELNCGHFTQFEQWFVKNWKAEHKLEKMALSEKVIENKHVVFVKGIDRITSLGFKRLIFAPHSLLREDNPTALSFAISTAYSEEGNTIFPAQALRESGEREETSFSLEHIKRHFSEPVLFKKLAPIFTEKALSEGPFSKLSIPEDEQLIEFKKTTGWWIETIPFFMGVPHTPISSPFRFKRSLQDIYCKWMMGKSSLSLKARKEKMRTEIKVLLKSSVIRTFRKGYTRQRERIEMNYENQLQRLTTNNPSNKEEILNKLEEKRKKELLALELKSQRYLIPSSDASLDQLATMIIDMDDFVSYSAQKKVRKIIEESTYFKEITYSELIIIYVSWLSQNIALPSSLSEDASLKEIQDFIFKWTPYVTNDEYIRTASEKKYQSLADYQQKKPNGSRNRGVPYFKRAATNRPAILPVQCLDGKTLEILKIFASLEATLGSFKGTIKQIALLRQLLIEKDVPKEKTEIFFRRLLYLYQAYFTIKDEDFPYIYAAKKGIELKQIGPLFHEFKTTLDDAAIFLSSLDIKTYTKILQLMIEEMTDKLDLQKRNRFLRIGELSNYQILQYSSLSLVARAYAVGLPKDIVTLCINYCHTPRQLQFIIMILSENEMIEMMQDKNPLVRDALIYLIRRFVQKEIPHQILREALIRASIETTCISEIVEAYASYTKPIIEELRAAHQKRGTVKTSETFFNAHLQKNLEDGVTFSATGLYTAFQDNPSFEKAVRANDFETTMQILAKTVPNRAVRAYDLAINHATEQEGTYATCKEATQNACDASLHFIRKIDEGDDAIEPSLAKRDEVADKKDNTISTIRYKVEILDGEDPALMFQIADGVGLWNLKTILFDLLIPDVSEKSKEEGFVGEMGNGSFQVYRDATMVTLLTRSVENPQKVYFVQVIPVREKKEVIDLKIISADVSDKFKDSSFFGTEISVLFKTHEGVNVRAEAMAFREYLKSRMGMTYVGVPNPALNLVLEETDGTYKNISQIDMTSQAHLTAKEGTKYSFLKLTDPKLCGAVLTGGYLFKDLSTFMIEERLLPRDLAEKVCKGWALNLPVGSYAPVQSRSRVQLIDRKELKKFVHQWLFHQMLYEEHQGGSKEYFPHFNSSCSDFSQVFPGAKKLTKPNLKELEGLQSFFVHYPLSFTKGIGYHSFYEFIDSGYDLMVKKLLISKEKWQQILNSYPKEDRKELLSQAREKFTEDCLLTYKIWQKFHIEEGENIKDKKDKETYFLFLDQVVFSWFDAKVKLFSKDFSLRSDEKVSVSQASKNDRKVIAGMQALPLSKEEVLSFLTVSLSVYCELVFKLNGFGKKPPKVSFEYDEKSMTKAYYNAKKNEIVINTFSFKVSDLLELVLAIEAKKPLSKSTPGYALLEIVPGSCGTLNHELEHARRSEDCIGKRRDTHGPGENANGKSVHFEACAASYARKALRLGLFSKWSDALQKSIEKKEELQKTTAILRDLEKKNRNLPTQIFFS